ncbi:hypothetical protein J5N97_026021 [Dioscorea zingiberensis]|uniref:RING-CH-type domain-containing protein n=1 Tax=Dioscorea zingiberensis TaxID=325984 RepID=A0A9D5C288_9LILI|nr:hypothetical protein J5N97_026021 [Dioscorea zingiberensis]
MATPSEAAPAGEPLPAAATGPAATVVQKAEAVIDVKCGGGAVGDADHETEKICRICHLSPDQCCDAGGGEGGSEGSEMIQIGCGCRGELGIAHRHCAEAWFRVKGNRCCEICGVNAKNITGEDDSSFMEEWHERRMFGNRRRRNLSERDSCWRVQRYMDVLKKLLSSISIK